MSGANYGGRQPNNTSYIKTFVEGDLDDLWKQTLFVKDKIKINVLTPTNIPDIYIPGNIYLGGKIITTIPHSSHTKTVIDLEEITNIMKDQQKQIQDLQKQVQKLQMLDEA